MGRLEIKQDFEPSLNPFIHPKLPLDKLYNILYIKIMTTIAISDFRAMLPKLINDVDTKLKRFVVTVSGKPKAVVMSLDELESLEETAEILSTPGSLKAIKKSQEEIKKGKFITLKELEKKNKL